MESRELLFQFQCWLPHSNGNEQIAPRGWCLLITFRFKGYFYYIGLAGVFIFQVSSVLPGCVRASWWRSGGFSHSRCEWSLPAPPPEAPGASSPGQRPTSTAAAKREACNTSLRELIKTPGKRQWIWMKQRLHVDEASCFLSGIGPLQRSEEIKRITLFCSAHLLLLVRFFNERVLICAARS